MPNSPRAIALGWYGVASLVLNPFPTLAEIGQWCQSAFTGVRSPGLSLPNGLALPRSSLTRIPMARGTWHGNALHVNSKSFCPRCFVGESFPSVLFTCRETGGLLKNQNQAMKKRILFSSMGAFALAGALAHGQMAFLYQQTFDNTTDQLRVEDAGIGWLRATHNGTDTDQPGRLSNALGPDGEQGFAYTFRGGNNATLMWNGGVDFAQSEVTGFSAMVGHGNAANLVRFLIRIDDAGTDRWYASALGGAASTTGNADWFQNGAELFQLSFATAAWVPVLNPDGDAPFGGGAFSGNNTTSDGFTLLGGGDLTTNAVSLPAGNITAVGAYVANLGGSSTRFDDFTVIPEPSTYAALIGLLALGLVAYRRRRR
jgi:hypothetical protein